MDRSGPLDFDDSGGKIVTEPAFGECRYEQPVGTFLNHVQGTTTRSNL